MQLQSEIAWDRIKRGRGASRAPPNYVIASLISSRDWLALEALIGKSYCNCISRLKGLQQATCGNDLRR
jgi:hypothetical protein